MKLVEYKQFGDFGEDKKLNKGKIAIACSVVAIIIAVVIVAVVYFVNSSFRNFMDQYVLLKGVKEGSVAFINVDSDDNIYAHAYHDYVAVLANNKLNLYNSSGKSVETIGVTITEPIFESNGKYLAIAEKAHQKLYLIKGQKLIWEDDVEGNIYRVSVNDNGYVSAIVSGTSHKSVIITYDSNGNEIFKTFLSSTIATDVSISSDNKYLSFCELNTSGTLLEAEIKTISIDNAKSDPANSIIYTYKIPSNELVVNLEYHQKNKLICMCDSSILSLENGNIVKLNSTDESNVTYAGIGLFKSYFKVVESFNGINNQYSDVEIFSTNNGNKYSYRINGIAKAVFSKGGIIAVNLGTKVYFIAENGWLIKEYTATQEVKQIVIGDNIAGIIYRNKISFVGL